VPLTIVYLGNFRHPWCTEVHIARELEGLGCHVMRWQEPSDPTAGTRFSLRRLREHVRSERPDLVLFTRTWGLPGEVTRMWREFEELGAVTASYHLDLYVGLQREAGIEDDPFWTTGFVFTPDGDPRSAEFFASKGINHHWLSPAVVSDECFIGDFDSRFDYDVVFVGSEGYHPEWPWRGQLIHHLRERYGPRFRRFGGDTPEGPIRGKALNDLYATARVVVGDSLCLPGHTHYWSDRYFETLGRGGFLIAPEIIGLDQFLTPNAHYVPYRHPQSALAALTDGEALHVVDWLVRWALREDQARRAIQIAGHEHVRANHTYKHRLAEALAIMGFVDPPAPIAIDKLELGSGYNPTPGFVHLDVNPNLPDVDIVGAAWPLDLPDGSVNELRAVDVLEHVVPYTQTDEVLADWFRVLAPGGRLYVQVPDAEMVMRWFVESPHLLVERLPANLPQTPLSGAAWRLLGGQGDGVYASREDWLFNCHFSLWSEEWLTASLERAGFVVESLETNGHPNLLAWARKPL